MEKDNGAGSCPELVRVRIGPYGGGGEKRRSWHAARVSDDIQRSLVTAKDGDASSPAAGQSLVGSRSSWQPGHDWSSYQQQQQRAVSAQVELQEAVQCSGGPRFTIASWSDAHPTPTVPVPRTMDAIDYDEPVQPVVVHELNGSSLGLDEPLRTPILPRSFVLGPDGGAEPELYNKRLVSSVSDQYFDVVVRELRGAVPRP